jgi:Transposase DDE domain group 1
MHEVLFEQFVGSSESAPSELILDFDCTDDRVHGLQEGRPFHGYYYDFCFLPFRRAGARFFQATPLSDAVIREAR